MTHRDHFAKNVFFGCIDDRLTESHASFIKEIGGAFSVGLAGGALAFLSERDSETAIAQVVAAYKINQINHVYLESHVDCGAYKLSGVNFDDLDEETETLERDLGTAKTRIEQALVEAGAKLGEVAITTSIANPLEDRAAHYAFAGNR